MKLKRLLRKHSQITVRGPRDTEITGVCADSRLVAPGNLFIARKGHQFDGASFIADAVAAGASAILTDLYDPSLRHVTQVIAHDVNSLEAPLASEFYGHPSRDLFVIGITGTNGKTTTAFIVRHLLECLQVPCGLMGSIEHIVGDVRYSATQTTPSVTVTHKVLRDMLRARCQAAVMEVTSHGLDQGRVDDIAFDIGIFTNLSQDHLDYHRDMKAYRAAKALLFAKVKCPILNADDPAASFMQEACSGHIMTYGFSAKSTVWASDVELSLCGSRFTVTYGEQSHPFRIPLIGRFNIANALAALCVGCARGVPLDTMATILETIRPIPGRLESVPTTKGPKILVDYAHTPSALEQVLSTIREVTRGPIITVFGCGGDRDITKRPLMGCVAHRLSDRIIVTSDNPRSEDPKAICDAITADLAHDGRWEVCVDRTEAIGRAIGHADQSATVVIAGKGHETTQVYNQGTIPFDDRQVALNTLS